MVARIYRIWVREFKMREFKSARIITCANLTSVKVYKGHLLRILPFVKSYEGCQGHLTATCMKSFISVMYRLIGFSTKMVYLKVFVGLTTY